MKILFTLEIVIIPLILWFIFDTIYYLVKLPKPKFKHKKSDYKKPSKFHRIFIDLPPALARDLLNSKKGYFNKHGLILFEGVQGAGKTISMVHYMHELHKEYPDVEIFSNFGLSFETDGLVTWEPVVGHSGVFGFDEISLWFSNRNYASFPPELLRTIVQNRKEHRLILGTCQQINMVDKQIRRQCTEVRKVRTIGPITIVWRFRPLFSSDGDIIKLASLGMYFFIQSDEIRNSYDTFRVVENLKSIGFQERRLNE